VICQPVICRGFCENRAIGKVFKGKAIEKGVAFPTCVSVNRYANAAESCMQHCCALSVQTAGDDTVLSRERQHCCKSLLFNFAVSWATFVRYQQTIRPS
jgi:hypothetical protein